MFKEMMAGKFDNLEVALQPMYENMAKSVKKQKERLGGNMAIAQAVFTRSQRDSLRKLVGPDLVFIVLNMSKECQIKRVKGRHGDTLGDQFMNILIKYAELCEPAEYDEENAYNVMITDDMNRDDVLQKIIEIVQKL